jgi:hypothetical protein
MAHTCNICTKTLSSQIHLKRHMKTHETVKCNLCNFASRSQKKLEDHISTINLGVKNFRCEECDYATSQKRYLVQYIKGIHREIRDNECSSTDCFYSSSSSNILKIHVKSFHEKSGTILAPFVTLLCKPGSTKHTCEKSAPRKYSQHEL